MTHDTGRILGGARAALRSRPTEVILHDRVRLKTDRITEAYMLLNYNCWHWVATACKRCCEKRMMKDTIYNIQKVWQETLYIQIERSFTRLYEWKNSLFSPASVFQNETGIVALPNSFELRSRILYNYIDICFEVFTPGRTADRASKCMTVN